MAVSSFYNKKIVLVSVIIALFLFTQAGVNNEASAQSTPVSANNFSSIGKCGTSSNQYNVFVKQIPSNSELYIKLDNNQESGLNTSVYFQSFSDGQCHLIGTLNSTYNSWGQVGNYSLDTSSGGAFIVAGNDLGSLPYQAVASLLILPKPAACVPVTNCQVSYEGNKGVLSPEIISGATDQVAVYVANNPNGVGYSKVTYYSNDQFLYDSKKLEPINRDYLDGGVHQVSIIVSLSNQETVTINQTINMGTDYTGSLYIKSLIYRTHNKAIVFMIPALIVVILLLLLWVARLIYKRRRFTVEHGLDNLPKESTESADINSEEHKTIIG